jgi:PAS domain-containing protein
VEFLHRLSADSVDITGAEAASVMLADTRGGLRLVASPEERMQLLELFEIQSAQGPCLDAFGTGVAVQASAAESRSRWRLPGPWQASDTPLLVIDTDLVIRDVNPAYLRVTDRTYDELLGSSMFEAFPANRGDPHVTSETNISAYFENVFRNARRDQMPVHRYDLSFSDAPGVFARNFWTSVTTPLRDQTGHLYGALHHAENLTSIVESIWESGPPSAADLTMHQQTWNSLVTALAREIHGHKHARRTAEQLQHALTSRIFIEQAKGMIAGREGISIDQAYARLRQYARRHNAVLHDVARAVVELGLSV